MEIDIVKKHEHGSWASKLTEYDFSIFISPAWVESFREPGTIPVYLDYLRGGTVIAKSAGISVGKEGSIKYKLLFYAGPALQMGLSEEVRDECLHALVEYGKRNKFNRVVVLSYDYPNTLQFDKIFYFAERNEFIVDLTMDKDEINKNISRNIKRNVKKVTTVGYQVRESDHEDLCEPLIQLMEETKKVRLSKGYEDYNYFYLQQFKRATLYNLVRRKAFRFFVVEKNNVIYAVLAVLVLDHRAYALFIGVKADGYREGISSFLDYSAMMLLKDREIKYINFGGVPDHKTHSGLILFKEKLGAKPFKSRYGTTYFLCFPYSVLNPVIRLARRIPDNGFFRYIKRQL